MGWGRRRRGKRLGGVRWPCTAGRGFFDFLCRLGLQATPTEVVDGLYQEVQLFSEGADRADDITILAIQYLGG